MHVVNTEYRFGEVLAEGRDSARTFSSARRAHAALEIMADGDLRTPPRGVKQSPSASGYLTSSRDACRFSVLRLDAGGRRCRCLAVGLKGRTGTEGVDLESWHRSGRRSGRYSANVRETALCIGPCPAVGKAYGVATLDVDVAKRKWTRTRDDSV
ncbi:hypothetical protein B0H13DRAFT_1897641 [Mycena leptocephala]|nr:hypothetical protein B0H13DRAFT_1897641 [Mycena leptocephala]